MLPWRKNPDQPCKRDVTYGDMILCVFVVGQLQCQRVCICTWYDFRGLDLHKPLVGEGVPEELAHSRLQAEDGLAGGGLRDTNTRM